MPGKMLDDEIWRAVEEKVRNLLPHPPVQGKVTRVYNNGHVDVDSPSFEFVLDDVPVVNCNPKKGDMVIVDFIHGHPANPILIGVIGESSTPDTDGIVNAALQTYTDKILPVGSIITSADGTNPGTRIPNTTWVSEAEGKFILGAGGGYTAGQTGGSASITLAVNNLPSHKHNVTVTSSGAGTTGGSGVLTSDNGGSGTSGSGGSGNSGSASPTTNTTGNHVHTLNYLLNLQAGTSNGRWMIGYSGTDGTTQSNSAGDHSHTVNSHTHTTPAHTHTTPNHQHTIPTHTHSTPNHTHTLTEDNIGSAAPISIMPPYIVRYRWRRTA